MSHAPEESAPLPADAQDVARLVDRARQGVATVLNEGGESVAAIVPIGILNELMDPAIRAAVERARARGAGGAPGIEHGEAMASLGRDSHGKAA